MQAFISYAHDDHEAFDELSTCLKPVTRAFDIDVWTDKRLRTGHAWNDKIGDAIAASDLLILLMSNRFFGSDYIFDHELPAISGRRRNGSLVAPVLIERCYWPAFVGVLQASPMTERGKLVPADEWRPRRKGYSTACMAIAAAIKDHFGIDPKCPFDWGVP